MQKLSHQNTRQLQRCSSPLIYQDSKKCGTNTTIHTSSSSIQSADEECRKLAIKWLMAFDRKITKDTNYLSVWYLNLLLKNGLALKQSNWQLVSASIMMFASKMNQIYPPSIESILKRCKSQTPAVTRQAMIEMQGNILNILDFNVAVQSPYNLLSQKLRYSKKDLQECQKLLNIIIYNKEINQQSSQVITYAIIYLIARAKIDGLIQGQNRIKVKATAQNIYSYYKQIRQGQQTQKAKQKLKSSVGETNYHSKPNDDCSTKQNSSTADTYSSTGSNSKSDYNTVKNAQHTHVQLTRVNSYKFIPKQKPFTQTTNILGKQKKLIHCASREQFQQNRQNRNIYSYA